MEACEREKTRKYISLISKSDAGERDLKKKEKDIHIMMEGKMETLFMERKESMKLKTLFSNTCYKKNEEHSSGIEEKAF